jgi:hypothetical protein
MCVCRERPAQPSWRPLKTCRSHGLQAVPQRSAAVQPRGCSNNQAHLGRAVTPLLLLLALRLAATGV